MMRVISHFIPFGEYVLQNERGEKRIFCSPKWSFSPLGFSKYGWHLKRSSRGVCVLVCVSVCVNHTWIPPYTLTLECTLKDQGGILDNRILRDDVSKGHTKPQKMAKGCVEILKTGLDPEHPQEQSRPVGSAMIG